MMDSLNISYSATNINHAIPEYMRDMTLCTENASSTYGYEIKPNISNTEDTGLTTLPRPSGYATSIWLSPTLTILLIISMHVFARNKKQYLFTLRNIFSKADRKVAYDTDTKSDSWSVIILFLISILSHALFIITCMNGWIDSVRLLNSHQHMLAATGSVAVVLLFQYIVLKIGGIIFNISNKTDVFSQNYFTLITIQGILLLIVDILIIFSYNNYFTIIATCFGIFIIFITFIITVIKSIQIFFNGALSLFYIFLYLCTSEILPLLIAVKVVFNW